MSRTTVDIGRFLDLFNMPDFLRPWLDRFFENMEIELVLLLGGMSLPIDDILKKWRAVYGDCNSVQMQTYIKRCYNRGILVKDDDGWLRPADFHTRFDIWALFEGWKDLPTDIRDKLNRWELDYYQQGHLDQIRTLKAGGKRNQSMVWPTYLLLHEAEAVLDRVDHVYLWPCNCRAMMEGCRKNLYTCLRFSNNRDWGWEISKYRAKQILHQANKNGLMQNGEVRLTRDGSITGAICNCCADCCFPHQMAERLDARNIWPLTRYKADHIKNNCVHCGRCVKRCPFGAFAKKDRREIIAKKPDPEKRQQSEIVYNRDLCRGCGVCSTGCPEKAVEMIRLKEGHSIIDALI